ncbi:MAG: FIG00952399: hypothetical protein [uncultured Sulfurovum sp.]|uniref:Delta 1-pyrroline-5-carboxylate reductase n=1 Tax=uncultured Sulfurovum sp. TaxID=269237 RepID=A0A6S6SA29_9BACT|nr:MAG: FIG00952399: hypothetical protein [uncultured Sulfurovum sp.]
MRTIYLIARSEWLYWIRSRLVLGSIFIFLVLLTVSAFFTASHMDAENHARVHQQTKAEETFLAQPDRHPHRMVHYGHYAFRTPAPLAGFDPGLDTVTGQSIFLEGHRQNTVMFPESSASSDFGGLSGLNPALIYQIFAPLLIILLAYNAIGREREAVVLTPMLAIGITGRTLIVGKALALLSFMLLMLIPLLISSAFALVEGESFMALLTLFIIYFMYLAIWIGLTLFMSIILKKGSTVLAVMTGLWFIFSLVLPSIAVNIATKTSAVSGKIETDLAMLKDVRKVGDGHNTKDPAFQKMRQDLLAKYKVERLEDLPINFRGMVAMEGERKLTEVLNRYAKERMLSEAKQEKLISSYGWFTPSISIAFASRSIAGTDLSNYHRFQKEAEALRYKFIQGLNRVQTEALSYEDDMNRNKDKASSERARINSSNWEVLDKFEFGTEDLSLRIANAIASIQMLLIWLIAVFGVLIWRSKGIKA